MPGMIWDITPPVTRRLAVWPGDTPPHREVIRDLRRGDPYTLSTLRATAHLGAHADAPSHYGKGAAAIDELPPELFVGPCRVVRAAVTGGRPLLPGDVGEAVDAERILFATGTYPDPESFREGFASLSPALVAWLGERGVRLVGIDTPSIDPFDSADAPAHHACVLHGIVALEGLWLEEVPAGRYELIALPLRLVGFEASPVRAILRA
jgi:arylformamidase